jgi:serine protease AprX
MWEAGHTGAGVDIALIDSGVVPVEGLTLPGKVINGPDLSFESQADNLRHLDTFGHGTHLAGIIAGKDPAVVGVAPENLFAAARDHFVGIAPDARLVSLKVADASGAVDVTQVIAAIDWVVQHRNDNGLNIRVMNLAFGTDSVQPHQIDPLSFAVEQAWKAGIVVVVAGGNDGASALLRNPATNPYVISVGAYDTNGTNITGDDFIADFTSCGNDSRTIDVAAPGRSILGLRAPGSLADEQYEDARVKGRLFKGTGTSQAAAVVSGSVALMLDQRPELTPDQVKELLVSTADYTKNTGSPCGRRKMVDLREILVTPTPSVVQNHPAASGLGSLEAARGSSRVADNGVELSGEQDIFGNAWNGASWSSAASAGLSWSGGDWNGAAWSGASWSGLSWSGLSWSGLSWSGLSWSGASWSSKSWSGASWSGLSWSGASWSGASWSGASWSGGSWSGHVWTGLSWR